MLGELASSENPRNRRAPRGVPSREILFTAATPKPSEAAFVWPSWLAPVGTGWKRTNQSRTASPTRSE
jgi:hypothetical protein